MAKGMPCIKNLLKRYYFLLISHQNLAHPPQSLHSLAVVSILYYFPSSLSLSFCSSKSTFSAPKGRTLTIRQTWPRFCSNPSPSYRNFWLDFPFKQTASSSQFLMIIYLNRVQVVYKSSYWLWFIDLKNSYRMKIQGL